MYALIEGDGWENIIFLFSETEEEQIYMAIPSEETILNYVLKLS